MFCLNIIKNNYIIHFIVFFILAYFIITDLYLIISNILENYFIFTSSDFINNLNDNNSSNISVDRPDSKWPSGSTQVATITTSALLAAKNMPGGPLQKGAAAVLTGAVSGITVGYFHAIEHPNGFNNFWKKVMEKSDITNGSINKGVSRFMSDDDSEFWSNLLAKLVKILGMEPKSNNLPLDVLVNQHGAMHYLLFFMLISILLLTVIFLFTIIFYNYRNYFIKRFTNKYINLYIRYQIFLAKVFFIIYPIIFCLGMFVLAHGLYYLSTHPIILE